mmetsp:Transcript_9803/g.15853  ORF Transcript_9803/g.15853 Transcript_9803/m.15853 type:complete len:103 (+) Transcript_9803:517-825(+)
MCICLRIPKGFCHQLLKLLQKIKARVTLLSAAEASAVVEARDAVVVTDAAAAQEEAEEEVHLGPKEAGVGVGSAVDCSLPHHQPMEQQCYPLEQLKVCRTSS